MTAEYTSLFKMCGFDYVAVSLIISLTIRLLLYFHTRPSGLT